MPRRMFAQNIVVLYVALCSGLLIFASSANASELEGIILENSQNEPSKVVEALKKADRTDYSKLSPELLVKASYATAISVDIPLTITLTDLLLAKADLLESDRLKGQAYYNRGAAYASSGTHDLALDSFLLALASFESDADEKDVARIKAALAIMYVEIGEYELAKPYFKEALESHKSRNDVLNMAIVMQNRGFMKILLGEFIEARKDLLLSLEYSKSVNFKPSLPILYKNLGKVEAEQGNPELALSYLDQALQESNKTDLEHHQSEIMREISRLQLKNGFLEKSRSSIVKSIEIGEKYDLLKQLKDSYLFLAELEVVFGNYKAAYLAKEKASVYSEKMGDSRIAANLSRLDRYTATLKEQNKRLVLEKEKEIATLATEREELLKNFSIIVAVIAIFLAAYFLRRFSHTNKQAEIYEKQSKIDVLTGVWNRRAGEAQLARLCQRDLDSVKVFSIAMLDIDHFKQVNDRFGHDVGDSAIVSICNLIQENLRPTDMLCRWGGEEFLLILESFDASNAFDVCERIRQKIASTSIEKIGNMTVSIGISMFDNDEIFELIKRGDQALYRAKHLGRNQVIIKGKPQENYAKTKVELSVD
ncbi:tetratricopeptide repeat-containing diguanylate cyclase [Aliikangiella coralliicola]|uniref:diguanylate cyclase n=1 Tax=Aliikangiella coralliicola TaxID=2592383 RepID=A0A545UHB3_9GAMM|nr:diguanylate cyclase [Aliikangiella coralliicola]TQV88849.1 diguanylate cyclase [Aliikangiella coralliicola]